MKIALDPYMIRHEPLDRLPQAVAELGYAHIELSPRIQRRPCGEVGIADFDQIRLQILQDVSPRRQAQGEAITFAEGQGGRRNRVDTVMFTQSRAGNQQAVANGVALAKATVFGIQVSPHASAGRGVEHGDVGDMHGEQPSAVSFSLD